MITRIQKRSTFVVPGATAANVFIPLHPITAGESFVIVVHYRVRDQSNPSDFDAGCVRAVVTDSGSGVVAAPSQCDHSQATLYLGAPNLQGSGGDICLAAMYSSSLTYVWDVFVEVEILD